MKKIIALLLSLVMAFAMCTPAFAVTGTTEPDYDGYPVVIVRGIDFGSLVNLETGEKAMQINVGDILDTVIQVVLSKFIEKKDDFIIPPVMDLVWDIMVPIASNPDGSSMDPKVGMKQYYGSIDEFPEELTDEYFELSGEGNLALSLRDRIGAENVYYFTYDWRKSPEKIAEELGFFTAESGAYPGWEFKKNSPIRDAVSQAFEKLYDKKAKTIIIHAGLECGLFSGKIENLDCVSTGPTAYDIHTPEERLLIPSAIRFWKLLLEVLKNFKGENK